MISLMFTFDLCFHGFLRLPVGFGPEVPKRATSGRLVSNFHIALFSSYFLTLELFSGEWVTIFCLF